MKITAEFAASDDVQDAGETVKRTGKFFEVGRVFITRDGLKFGLDNNAEADAAIAKFQPAPINYNHEPGPLDGFFGNVTRIWREGKDIVAEYTIPKELHDLTKGKPFKISSEWDIPSKTVVGAALVNNPAVMDAAMFSAATAYFARHDTPEGQDGMQMLHDLSARMGAVCKKPDGDDKDKAEMMARHEATGFQLIHDMSAKHGASCSDGGHIRTMSSGVYRFGAYEMLEPEPDQTPPAREGKETKTMTLTDRVKAYFSKSGEQVPTELADAMKDDTSADVNVVNVDPAVTAQFAALTAKNTAIEEQNKSLLAEFAAMKIEQRQKEANSFCVDMIREAKMIPSERPIAYDAYFQALTDDAATGTKAVFSRPKEGGKAGEMETAETTRVALVRAQYAGRQPHAMFSEKMLGHISGVILPTDDTNKKAEMSQSREDELHEKTPEGRAYLAARDAK